MTPLEVLSHAKEYWTNPFEIAMLTTGLRPELVPTVLEKLEEHDLVTSRADDEGGRVYKITPAGLRHHEGIEKRRSSYPPPRISWPPVR